MSRRISRSAVARFHGARHDCVSMKIETSLSLLFRYSTTTRNVDTFGAASLISTYRVVGTEASTASTASTAFRTIVRRLLFSLLQTRRDVVTPEDVGVSHRLFRTEDLETLRRLQEAEPNTR